VQLFVRRPNGEAAAFQDAAEDHLSGSLVTLSAILDAPPTSLEEQATVLHEIFAHPELLATADAAGVDADEFRRLHDNAVAGRLPLTSHLRPSSIGEVWERLCWMLTARGVFYSREDTPRPRAEVERLAGAYARWWLGARSDAKIPIAPSWRFVAIDRDGIKGFANNFYDSAFVATRGTELRLLLQNGSD
jgi:hypothetical protein